MKEGVSAVYVPCVECGQPAARIPFDEFERLFCGEGPAPRLRCRSCAGKDPWLPNVTALPADDEPVN